MGISGIFIKMELLYFILASFGMTQILVYGKIFEKIRPKHYFFHCPMCVGFWAGFFLFMINGLVTLFEFQYLLGNAFVLSCLSSGTSYVLCMLFDDSGLKITHKDQK